jgi:hypothetical protein
MLSIELVAGEKLRLVSGEDIARTKRLVWKKFPRWKRSRVRLALMLHLTGAEQVTLKLKDDTSNLGIRA